MASVFEQFCQMMNNLPAKAAKKAAMVERRMLEKDTATGREKPVGEVASVLAFCRFIESGAVDKLVSFREVSLEHWPSYVNIVHKLVDGGELSQAAKDEFNSQCSRALGRMAD